LVNVPFGELAGLVTAVCWSFSSFFLTAAGHRIGSIMVNQYRLAFATLYLAIIHLIVFGHILPLDAPNAAWFWLGISGFIGLVIGDSLLFKSFINIGPRSTMLLMTLAPVFSTIFAMIFLKEFITLGKIGAMLLTMVGIAWAIFNKSPNSDSGFPARHRYIGILCGIGGAFCQAIGLVLARKGLETEIPAFSANLIRMGSATVIIWVLVTLKGNLLPSIYAAKNAKAMKSLGIAAIIGPVVGVWLSLIALRYAPVGIASTMMSTSPILLIPLSKIILKEDIHIQSIIGSIVALIGVALLLIG
jgi:drug/metabolite transporter (DMT)-like permease